MRSVAVVAWVTHNSCSFPGVFFLFRLVSNFNTQKALTLLVHAGLYSYTLLVHAGLYSYTLLVHAGLYSYTLLVHAGLYSYFRNPLNADMDCRIFNVHM